MNGCAQIGAVTRAYKIWAENNSKRCVSSRSFIRPLSGVCSSRKIWDFRLSEMVSDALFKQKNSLPMPNKSNAKHLVLKICCFKRNLS